MLPPAMCTYLEFYRNSQSEYLAKHFGDVQMKSIIEFVKRMCSCLATILNVQPLCDSSESELPSIAEQNVRLRPLYRWNGNFWLAFSAESSNQPLLKCTKFHQDRWHFV